jgi:nucleoside-diphosphate-sugar epimerase
VIDGTSPVVGVTGSTGYLGRALVQTLRGQNLDVVEYRRNARDATDHDHVRKLALGELVGDDTFDGVSTVVHGAWNLRETDPELAWQRNVDGSKHLLEMALASGVRRFIFVSSMSAYFGTKQDYGLMKLAVERSVLEADQIVVRPGLVYGGGMGGMTGTLAKLARLPIIPVPSGAQQFTLHIDDFLSAMTTLVTASEVPSSVIGLAHKSPVPFQKLMRAFAAESGDSATTVVVPWRAVLALMQALEALNFSSSVRSDSLLGLVRPAPFVPGGRAAASLGLSFRAFPGVVDTSANTWAR